MENILVAENIEVKNISNEMNELMKRLRKQEPAPAPVSKNEVTVSEVKPQDISNVEEEDNRKKPFTIDNTDKLFWALRHMQEIKEREAERDRLAQNDLNYYNSKIEDIKQWRKNDGKEDMHFYDFLNGHCRIFLEQQIESGALGKKRSIKTPYGSVNLKKLPIKFNIIDKDACIKYLNQNEPDLIKQEPSKIKQGDFNKRLVFEENKVIDKETGQILDFVEGVQEPDKYYVKIAE